MNVLRRRSEVAFSLVIVMMAAYWIWEARSLPPRVQLVPYTIGFPVLAIALLQFVASLRALRQPLTVDRPETTSRPPEGGLDFSSADAVAATATAELAVADPEVDAAVAQRRGIQIFLWILGFWVAIMLLGFRVGAPLMTFLFLHIASREQLRVSLAFTFVTYVLLFAADFTHSVTLSTGLIAQAFGMSSFDSYITDPIVRLIRGE
jgi:hypothetical protein